MPVALPAERRQAAGIADSWPGGLRRHGQRSTVAPSPIADREQGRSRDRRARRGRTVRGARHGPAPRRARAAGSGWAEENGRALTAIRMGYQR